MERREGDQLVGAVVSIGSTARWQIIRWDYRRAMFTTRSLITKVEGEIPARMLEDGIAEGIIIIITLRRTA